MIKEILGNKTSLQVTLKSLDAAMLRSRVIANNIANITTPGFKRVEVSFEDELRKALDKSKLKGSRTDFKHIELGRSDISNVIAKACKPADPALPSGVNNVDIDMEMSKLAENQLMYTMGLKFVKGAYEKLNSAIKGKSINT